MPPQLDENHEESIEPGNLAHLVVLEDDPCSVDPVDIAEVGVRRTIVG